MPGESCRLATRGMNVTNQTLWQTPGVWSGPPPGASDSAGRGGLTDGVLLGLVSPRLRSIRGPLP